MCLLCHHGHTHDLKYMIKSYKCHVQCGGTAVMLICICCPSRPHMQSDGCMPASMISTFVSMESASDKDLLTL